MRVVTTSLLMLVLALTPGVANAHSKLVSTSPSDGAVLTTAPPEVVLTFDENLLQGANTISINDDLGNVIATTPVEPDGPTIRTPWPADLPAGRYQVAYRIVSGDGHPVIGAFAFELATTASTALATELPTTTPADPSPAASEGLTTRGTPDGPSRWWLLVLFGCAAVVAAATVVRRRRYRRDVA